MPSKLERIRFVLRRPVDRHKPRRFHAYCIGAAKTGTTSIASMFSSSYRAEHEPEVRRTTDLVIKYLEGKLSDSDLRPWLRARDRRFNLELESSHLLAYVSSTLAEVFPEAKFIVTVREPMSWLRSRLNFHHQVDPPAWRRYRDYFWNNRPQYYAPEEHVLVRYNLCTLDTYLSQYSNHYRFVSDNAPEDRTLYVHTSRINEEVDKIGDFVGAKPSLMRRQHSNRNDDKITPLDSMPPEFVAQKILKHCRPVLQSFFPERLSYYEQRV